MSLLEQSQLILTKQQRRQGHIVQKKRDFQKSWPPLALLSHNIRSNRLQSPHTCTMTHIHTHRHARIHTHQQQQQQLFCKIKGSYAYQRGSGQKATAGLKPVFQLSISFSVCQNLLPTNPLVTKSKTEMGVGYTFSQVWETFLVMTSENLGMKELMMVMLNFIFQGFEDIFWYRNSTNWNAKGTLSTKKSSSEIETLHCNSQGYKEIPVTHALILTTI